MAEKKERGIPYAVTTHGEDGIAVRTVTAESGDEAAAKVIAKSEPGTTVRGVTPA